MRNEIPAHVRLLVLERDEWSCVRCSRSVGEHRLYSLHHRCPRRMGGSADLDLNLPSNIVTLCGTGTTGCHGWVESNRAEAEAKGWLLSTIVDRHRAVETIVRSLVTLHDDGTRTNRREGP